jgi:molybdopterin molybdotransferase
MPQGVDWTPLDVALARLKDNLHCVVEHEDIALDDCLGRIVAVDIKAARSNPPFANSAVDGYGFSFADLPSGDVKKLPLVAGRSAAGQEHTAAIPVGQAVRVLTGAKLPSGVDTVILEEDVSADETHIVFHKGIKAQANTRLAGEDAKQGELALAQGHRIRAVDMARLASVGIGSVPVYKPLRVGVLSTGTELVAAGETPAADQIFDANRPMLRAILAGWGMDVVDLGFVPDDARLIQNTLEQNSKTCHVILTSGGASAGDEDHISRLLRMHADMQSWRIAIKPGRPIALALWNGTPIIGLPGNPVAALVCTLVFGKPTLDLLAGAGWKDRTGLMLPATFSKNKKAGRREFLRACLRVDGTVERFRSEGSGLVSGLSWANGLIELGDDAQQITKGDLVQFHSYASFGI